MSDQEPGDRVVVAVLTFRRPQHLDAIVAALRHQLDTVADLARAELLVVDNDPDGGARDRVEAVADPRVRYVHEREPGIVAARNRALDEAAGADVLVFIDDDERPTEPWLRSLLSTWREYRPAGVVGPIVCVFDTEPEEWIRQGGFFTRRRMPTGSTVSVAATNNLLLDLAAVRALGLRFDPRYSQIGGSDHLFTRQLVTRGGTLLWNDDAIVHDLIPDQRTTRRWVTRRAYRIGTSASLVEVDLAGGALPRARARVRQTASGATRVIGGAARFAAGLATGSTGRRAQGVRTVHRGLGLIAGAYGRGYAEYRREAAPAPSATAVPR